MTSWELGRSAAWTLTAKAWPLGLSSRMFLDHALGLDRVVRLTHNGLCLKITELKLFCKPCKMRIESEPFEFLWSYWCVEFLFPSAFQWIFVNPFCNLNPATKMLYYSCEIMARTNVSLFNSNDTKWMINQNILISVWSLLLLYISKMTSQWSMTSLSRFSSI